ARVTGRFPEVQDVPDGPVFAELVTQAVPALQWDGTHFIQRDLTSSVRASTATVTDAHTADAPAVDRALRASLRSSSALTLAVSPQRYSAAARGLARTYGVAVVDIAGLVVSALREGADRHGADWDAVTALDAHPERDDLMGILRTLARETVPPRWEEAVGRAEPVL